MANRNAFAIVGIVFALIIGVIVGVGIVGTILLFFYGIVVSVLETHLASNCRIYSRETMPGTSDDPVTSH